MLYRHSSSCFQLVAFLKQFILFAMGDCSVGDFLLVFLLLATLHNGLSDGDSDNEVPIAKCLQLYSKPTGDKGDTLIIGSQSKYESVQDVFPGFEREICVPMDSVKYQRDLNKYGTKIFKRSNSEHFDVPVTEQLQDVKATDYFIQVGVQFFNCEGKKDGADEYKSYDKIVSSMSSIEDNIREIKYYSGVSVSIEECGGRKCIQVTETKCLVNLEGEEGLHFQFKCDNNTQRPANPPHIVPNMKVKHLHRAHLKSSFGYQYRREVEATKTISEEGESFRIGINENPSGIIVPTTPPTPPGIDFNYQTLKVGCQPPIINPTIFHPECYQKVKNEGENSLKDALLNDTQFRNSFTVVDETVQICKEMNGHYPHPSLYARVFYRVQMTVIGKTKVNKITYGTGITELYSINLADGAVTVRYTDMRFYDAITRTSVDNLFYRDVFPSDRKVFITSYSATDLSETPRFLDVNYKLWPEGIYSTFIGGDGYNLLVGSKPKLNIDFEIASCKRVDYSSDHFKTELKIVAEKGGEFYAHSTANLYNYSRPIQQQSWRCEYRKDHEIHKFIRVVNHLEFLVPVHTLESYDGVEILRRPSGEIFILEIFEVKYLLENRNKPEEHLTPIRATGTAFTTDDRPTDTAYVMGQGFNAISKSEVHPRFISQIPRRAHNRNDTYRAGTINDHKTLQIDGDGRDEMRFTTAFMVQDGKKKPFTGLLVCTFGARISWYEPYFEIFRDEQISCNNKIIQELTKEYFEASLSQEKWDCLKAGDTTSVQYFRIETKTDIIIKSAKHALKAIQFTPVDDVRLKLLESTGSSDNSKYKITYEGVRYYRDNGELGHSEYINIDFGGYFILESTPSPNRDWISGTINIKNAPSTSKDPVHVDETTQVYFPDDNRGREYSFHLPGDQTSKEWQEKRMMRIIGESYRVQQKIRLTSKALQCRENQEIANTAVSDNRLQTLVQTFKYSSQGKAAELEQNYHAGNTRVWKCTAHAPDQIKILRVMNNFVLNTTKAVEEIRTILYSDGITIFSGEDNNERMLEIAEVKFLNAVDYTNLKFEGELQFESPENVGPQPILVTNPEIQDVNYILNDNEFSITTFPEVVGETLEIWVPHPGIKSDEDKEGTRFQTTIRCDWKNQATIEAEKPKFIVSQRQEKKKEILLSTITKLKSYFDGIEEKTVKCEATKLNHPLYRVQTRMKLKEGMNIQQIFHQNGVKIYEDYKDRRHLIEITSYFEKRTLVPVKFEGLVILDFKDLVEKFKDKWNFPSHLDEPIFQFSARSRENGVTYLVQSQYISTIDNSGGDIVTCVKYEDNNQQVPELLRTRILVNENSNAYNPLPTIMPEADWKNNDHILYESYEKWSCKNQEYDLTRVVNKMLMSDNARVYYQDGVEVQRLILLDGKKFIQIKHERFFTKSFRNYLHATKYIGRLQLERQTLPGLEKMLSSPPFNIQVIGKKHEEQSPLPYQPGYIFTLDSMRYAALLKLGERSDGHNQSPPIKFSDKIDSLQTTFLKAKSSRIFQLGRFWNEVLSSAGTMKCFVYSTANLRAMRYIISPEVAKTKYYPRVAEYIDQKLYILTQDEFDELFTITSVRTWFCTDNTNEFLKVEAHYETSVIPFAVRSTDGVEVKLEKVEHEDLLRIKETVYIDMMNSKVYKRSKNAPIRNRQEDLLEFVIRPKEKGSSMRRFRQGCLGFLKGLVPCF